LHKQLIILLLSFINFIILTTTHIKKLIISLLILQIGGICAFAQKANTIYTVDSISQEISIKLIKIVEDDSTVAKQTTPDYVKKDAAYVFKFQYSKLGLTGYRKDVKSRRGMNSIDTTIIYLANGKNIIIDDAHRIRDIPIRTSDNSLVLRINSDVHLPKDNYSKLLFYNFNGELIREQLFDSNTRLGYPTVANNGYTVCSGLQRKEDITTIYFFSPKGDILWNYKLNSGIYPSISQVSHDGYYVALTYKQHSVREADSYILILNRKGEIIKNEIFEELTGYKSINIEFSDNNKYLFVHSVKGLYVYESETGRLVFFNKVRVEKYRTFISEKNNILITFDYKDEYWHLYTFDLRTKQKINDIVIEKAITSPEGKYLTRIDEGNFIINIEKTHFYYQIIKN